mgnify:FL=1|tara:strand:- start:1365 stop:1574 length:210 start_codon:yes stop_codon:yes gene_type:complete
MAGLGFKTFANGDVLLASEVQGYIQDQMIMVFANAAARDAAITSPSEGMFAFLKDTDKLTVYITSWGDF